MLRERFTQELKDAMRAGEKRKLATIRLIQSALKDKDIELRGAGKGEASDEEILAMLQKMIKQRQESAAIYAENNRDELAAQEKRGSRNHHEASSPNSSTKPRCAPPSKPKSPNRAQAP